MLYGLILLAIVLLPKYIRFRGSDYRESSGNGFLKTVSDRGNYGEFLTYYYLEKLGGRHRLMTNLYIPKVDGSTTEIDLIMISKTGIYVMESKNYSGWIFGDEKNRNWTQTLQNKQKNQFFNPVWQNKGHISALKELLGEDEKLFLSYIVFSERCTLKKVNVTSPMVKVIKRNSLKRMISADIENRPDVLSDHQVDKIYYGLQKYLLADEKTRKTHIEGVKLRKES